MQIASMVRQKFVCPKSKTVTVDMTAICFPRKGDSRGWGRKSPARGVVRLWASDTRREK